MTDMELSPPAGTSKPPQGVGDRAEGIASIK